MSTVASFTLEQYERMVEAGAFDGRFRQHVEFIHGEIREMNPIGSFHAQVLSDLTDWSYEVAPRKDVSIRVQTTLRMPLQNSAPEPDLIWVRRRNYSRQHPEPADVLLLVEVAESSLSEDPGEKLAMYARAGIADYWIVNLVDSVVEVYRRPSGQAYLSTEKFESGEHVSPIALLAARLEVGDIFPK
jgi:Uma2 family endonuclease